MDSDHPENSRRIGIAGGGAVARSLALALAPGFDEILIWTRRPEQGRDLIDQVRERSSEARFRSARSIGDLSGLELVILAVTDRAIAEVAELLADSGPSTRPDARGTALHLSGYHDLGIIAALETGGWGIGSAHPLISFPSDLNAEIDLNGAWWAVRGEATARERIRELIRLTQGHELELAGGVDAKSDYHAAASLAANGLVAVFDAAIEILKGATPDEDGARRAFAHLLRGVLENIDRLGAPDALTGPVVRGDAEVVAGHRRRLGSIDETGSGDLDSIYRVLSRRMLEIASRSRAGAPELRSQLERALSPSTDPKTP